MKLHVNQEKILEFLKKKNGNIENITLREIGESIGLGTKDKVNPQIIAHHLKFLEDKGYIRKENPDKKIFTILKEPIDDIVYVNLYTTTAQCGPDGTLGQDDIEEKIPLHSKTFGISNANDYFLIKASGDSMEPMINNGDLVLVRNQNQIENNQIGVVVHEGMPKIKKVAKIGQHYALVSLNNRYSNETIEENTDIRIVGLVKSIIRQAA